MKRFLQLIGVFGVNAIPAVGFLGSGWSVATTLAVYWIENLLSTILVALGIVIHRRQTHKRGHYKPDLRVVSSAQRQQRRSGTFLQGYLMTALPFAIVHGIFLAVLIGLILPQRGSEEVRIDRAELGGAALATAGFLLVGFCVDLFGIRERPFAWIRKLADYSFGRLGVVHMTIMGGMFAMMFFGATRSFFIVFIVLKTLLEISVRVPQYNPQEPPRLLASLLDRMGKQKGETFSEYWRRTHKEERESAIEDEENWSSP